MSAHDEMEEGPESPPSIRNPDIAWAPDWVLGKKEWWKPRHVHQWLLVTKLNVFAWCPDCGETKVAPSEGKV